MAKDSSALDLKELREQDLQDVEEVVKYHSFSNFEDKQHNDVQPSTPEYCLIVWSHQIGPFSRDQEDFANAGERKDKTRQSRHWRGVELS